MNRKSLLAALVLPLFVGACDKGPTDPSAPSKVSVKFGTSAPTTSASKSSAFSTSASTSGLVVQGTNGTLSISNISFIVSELELERLESTCDNSGSGNLCDDYEAPISFVKLPLQGGAVTVATDEVPHGQYDELDFEVENLDVDADDDSQKQQEIASLLNAIRTTHGFSNFPDKASMVVEGTFTPSGSTEATPFRVYFEAELKVELRFDPALTIDSNGLSHSVTVDVQPGVWFKKADGSVMDLSEFDYATTGSLIEFEMEMEKGFGKVKFDD